MFRVYDPLRRATIAMCSSKPLPAAVLYHYPCADGVFAALAAYLYHQAAGKAVHFFPNPVYRPLRLEDLPVDKFEVFYLLDFIGGDGFIPELCTKAKEVIVLDHHKTALSALPSAGHGPENLRAIIDMNRSGATIAYDYFQKELQGVQMLPDKEKQKMEQMYKYVEDGDLWRWTIPESKAFMSGLKDLDLEYNYQLNLSIFYQLVELDVAEVIARGEKSLSVKQAAISSALEKSFELQIGKGKYGRFLGVRADDIQDYRSDLGHQLAEKSLTCGLRAIGAVIYEVKELGDPTLLKVSLRSIDEDTTEISQAFGGGGHRCASSFMVKRNEFEQWI